jgi:quercetin dioxygenase-like cupin family protein
MSYFTHYDEHIGSQPDKLYKTTLFEGDHMLVGLNCLAAGQVQPVHEHATADKVYLVMQGVGLFTVGDETRDAAEGEVVWAPAGVPHGVENPADVPLVLLVGIAPPPGK